MLNIKGAFVLIRATGPSAVMLGANSYQVYCDRISVVGFEKANAYTFGHDVTSALPATSDCMEFIALNYIGAHQEKVRQICARIALGQPIGEGRDLYDNGNGGQGARIDAPKDKPSAPGSALTLESLTVSLS